MSRTGLVTLGLALTVLCSACSGGGREGRGNGRAGGDEAHEVQTEPVRLEEIRRPIELVGTLAASDEVTVSSEATGRVVNLFVDLGDRVRAGQVMVELDREKSQYHLDQQRAALNSALAKYGVAQAGRELPAVEQTPDVQKAAAQMAQSEQAYKRAQELNKRSLLPQQELEDAQAKFVVDKAAYESALQNAKNLRADIDASQASVKLSERELADASIRAPFDGYVQKRFIAPGQFVQVQTPVMALVKVDPLKLLTEVPERLAPWVRAGQSVAISVDAYPERQITGEVSRLSPAVNQQTRAFPIEARVPNADGLLKPGTFAKARFDSERADRILTVPTGAIQYRYGVNRVFIVKGDKLESVEVKLGDRMGDRVEIMEGVSEGQVVATSDIEMLADGMKVQSKTSQARDADPAPDGSREARSASRRLAQ